MPQQDVYRQTLGVQLKLCATLPPLFKGNTSVADCMPQAYSKLLKLMAPGVECSCV